MLTAPPPDYGWRIAWPGTDRPPRVGLLEAADEAAALALLPGLATDPPCRVTLQRWEGARWVDVAGVEVG